jgi:tRNA-specific 2-thiouridylase
MTETLTKTKTVVVGLSGGVDSTVAAFILKRQGYRVIGVFMRNWNDETVLKNADCHWIDDSNDAMLIAEHLQIPFQVLDLSKAYKERIIDYMFHEYASGRTPNPDVLCNREIKFDVFLEAALQLGADYVATGHYCQKTIQKDTDGHEYHALLAGADQSKDQSYFLCQIKQSQLQKILFPIGHLQKSEVRQIAENEHFINARKKDSQGLCFVGKIKLPDFLQMQLIPKKGRVIEIPVKAHSQALTQSNEILSIEKALHHKEYLYSKVSRPAYTPQDGTDIGEHNGAHFYTVGQRKGLRIGGKPQPMFVLSIDIRHNIIFTGMGEHHPGLWGEGLFMKNEDVSFIYDGHRMPIDSYCEYKVRIRYRQPLCSAYIIRKQEGYFLLFNRPQSAIAPGQFAAWYKDNELIGSGIISHYVPD